MKKNKFQENPITSGAIFLGLLTFGLALIGGGILALLALALTSSRLYQAKKAKEDKKFIRIGYFIMSITLVLWLISIINFVISNLQ